MNSDIFQSFFIGGFEGSTHRQPPANEHLDMISATKHDKFVLKDYQRLQGLGINTARDSLRWHLIEKSKDNYDWSSVLPMLASARQTGMQVIWDLMHFGWPEHIDVFNNEFIENFRSFARAFIKLHLNESDSIPFIAPINEPSFLSFAAGERGFFFPFTNGRGNEIKFQFARAIIAACEEILDICPEARIVHTDPLINIIAHPHKPEERISSESYRLSQFDVWDMIAGHSNTSLGGNPRYLDIMGLNYYISNQWIHNGKLLTPSSPYHLPLRFMINEIYQRYSRPVFISETGIEGEARPLWLKFIGREVCASLKMKLPVEGVCLYPIVDHPGWSDERYCPNGLWGYADEKGERTIFEPYAKELIQQQRFFSDLNLENENSFIEEKNDYDFDDSVSLPSSDLTMPSGEMDMAAENFDKFNELSRK